MLFSNQLVLAVLLTFSMQICMYFTTASFQQSQKISFNRDHTMVLFDPGASVVQETELLPMVKLVSQRFSKLLIDPLRDGHKNLSYIATAVATFNKFNRTSKSGPPTQLWIHIPYLSKIESRNPRQANGKNSLEYLKYTKDTVEAANNISPGSVEGIIFSLQYFLNQFNNSIIHSNVNDVKITFQNETKHDYKLGLMITDMRIFSNVSQYWNLAGILTELNISHIMTFASPSAHDIRMGVNASISKYRHILEQTKKEIVGLNSTRKIIPIFRTGYPDTSNVSHAKNKYPDLIQYWKNMSEWATQNKVIIAFEEAFDNPSRISPPSRSLGWWKRVDQDLDSDDFQAFQEKAEMLIETNVESLETKPVNVPQDVNFNLKENSKFSVIFNPPSRKGLSESEYTTKVNIFLEKFSERFGRLSIQDKDLNLEDIFEISKVITQWKAKNAVVMNTSIFFTLPSINEQNHTELRNKVFSTMKKTIDHLKSSLSSVQITYSKGLESRNAKSNYIVDMVQSYTNFVDGVPGDNSTKNISYKFGMELPLRGCQTKTSFGVIRLLLQYTQVITFKHLSTDANVRDGVDKTIAKLIKNFEKCRNMILNETSTKTGLEVGLSVGWRDTNGNGKKDYGNFLKFWRDMGAWAEKENVSVVMMEAFDIGGGFQQEHNYGWWEVVENGGGVESRYDFVEKRKTHLEELPPHEDPSDPGPGSSTTSGGFDFGDVDAGSTTKESFHPDLTTEMVQVGGTNNSVHAEVIIESDGGGMSEQEWSFLMSWMIPTVCAIIVATILALLIVWKMRKNPRELTKEEVKEFIEGNSRYADNLGEDLYVNSKYNKELHEIPLQNIVFDSVIGSGKFAIFYKALVAGDPGAVKVPKKACTKQYYKSMMMEVKIMANVGKHENVLSFYGANTKDLKKGTIYIITEYGANGTLYSYLRTIRYNLEAAEDDQDKKLSNIYELYKFANEIAAGMHYLSEKDIIHGDLSTKNVLLDGGNICKIYNYGLTRKLDENGEYVKRKDDTFPWQWIAIETLKHKIVTTRSDIWSYGVTLWEIFSLGRIPHKTHRQQGFLERLEKGLRLKRPKYATQDVYENIMQCWNKNPADRPKFQEEAEYFFLLMKEECDTLDKDAL